MSKAQSSAGFGVSDTFLDALQSLATKPGGSWWQDVLLRDDVFIAVRNNSLNVYHCGASIFRIDDLGEGQVQPRTHVKYLLKQDQRLSDLTSNGEFIPDDIGWSRYEGPETLDAMIKAAAALSGAEKTGLHPLILSSPKVIDVEVSLLRPQNAGTILTDETSSSGTENRNQDRIDVVTLEHQDDGSASIVFHEAKHFTNYALRAKPGGRPAVADQMERYRTAIAHHRDALQKRYQAVCAARLRLGEMQCKVRLGNHTQAVQPNADLAAVASGQQKLWIDPDPRLIVFGFDADQKDGRWSRDAKRLYEVLPGLKLKAVGNTKAAKGFF